MYAIFEDGARQYRVTENDVVTLAYRDVQPGQEIELHRVLLCSKDGTIRIGQPIVAGAKIVAQVLRHPSTKVYIQKFRRRKNYRRRIGHRQTYTTVKIKSIVIP